MGTVRKLFALVAAAVASGSAWSQAPAGTYVFTSGPGVGTPPFTVTGPTTNLGGSVTAPDVCSGLHIHGVFNGFGDPGGACGHGIIQLFVPPPPVSGGSAAGGMPTNVAGQLALTTAGSPRGLPISEFGHAFMQAFVLLGIHSQQQWSDLSDLERTQLRLAAAALQAPVGEQLRGQSPLATTAQPAPNTVQTALADPAQGVMSSPTATSWLEELAAFNDRDAEGYRRFAERVRGQADEYRKLADEARRQAERNRQRAEEARRDGRGKDAQDWEKEAERDDARAGERDDDARRLDGYSEEQQRREQAARDLAQERRDAAERAREQARQAERDRAERQRLEAEEKARVAREEREARRAREQAERDARRQAQEDRERAREREVARQRAAREREARERLDAEEARRNQRARGGSNDPAAAARGKKQKDEQEEKTWADYVIGLFEGKSETPEEKLLQAIKDKVEDKLKDEAMQRSGLDKVKGQLTEQFEQKLEEAGLGEAAGKLGEGIETIKKIKEIGDWMNSELDKMAGRQQRQANKIDAILDPRNEQVLRGASSGTIAGRDVLDVYKGAVEILK